MAEERCKYYTNRSMCLVDLVALPTGCKGQLANCGAWYSYKMRDAEQKLRDRREEVLDNTLEGSYNVAIKKDDNTLTICLPLNDVVLNEDGTWDIL
jgi:hypothetical protein